MSEEHHALQKLINYRISRADQSFKDALVLAENQSWNATVNRLYYSCFYILIALLAKHRLTHHTHAGVKQQFNQHFAQKGLIPSPLSKFYNQLFQERQTSDYEDFVDFDEPTAQQLIPKTKAFVTAIKQLIQQP